jgi:hypothetical protein
MSTTTVKLHFSTKHALDDFRGNEESYDKVINRLIYEVKNKNLVKELIAAYQNKAEEDKKIVEEWESSSSDWS